MGEVLVQIGIISVFQVTVFLLSCNQLLHVLSIIRCLYCDAEVLLVFHYFHVLQYKGTVFREQAIIKLPFYAFFNSTSLTHFPALALAGERSEG